VKNLVHHMAALESEFGFRLFMPASPVGPTGSSASPDGDDDPAGEPDGIVERVVLGTPMLDRTSLWNNVFVWNHLRLPIHLSRRPVDLLHGPFYTLPALCPAPAVVTIHDITFELHPEWYTRKARLAFTGFAAASARKARHVLTVSEHSRKDIITTYGLPPDRVTAVPLAPDPQFAPVEDRGVIAEVRRRYDLGEEYLLHVGSITPRRNIDRLLEAFAGVRRRAPHLTLVLAGRVEPPSPPVEVAIRRKGLTDVVRVTGYVRPEDLPALYAGAAAVVYPSLYEGFGLPVLEAMACGVPVLTSNNSCLPEVAGDAALLVDPLDTGAIAEGIWSILSDMALRNRLTRAGLARAAEFTWERTARETLAVYRRSLSLDAPVAGPAVAS
jgi:glycosyltransferase involved in cell wall biosynthesis